MCEIVVMLNSVRNPAYLNGDIMEVCPDGWKWGTHELNNPDWLIIKIPGVPVSTYHAFVSAIEHIDVAGNKTVVAPCSHAMNLATLAALPKVGNVATMPHVNAVAAIAPKAAPNVIG